MMHSWWCWPGRPSFPMRVVGVSAELLAARAARSPSELGARELRRWLLAEGLAVEADGVLYPTRRGWELGAGPCSPLERRTCCLDWKRGRRRRPARLREATDRRRGRLELRS